MNKLSFNHQIILLLRLIFPPISNLHRILLSNKKQGQTFPKSPKFQSCASTVFPELRNDLLQPLLSEDNFRCRHMHESFFPPCSVPGLQIMGNIQHSSTCTNRKDLLNHVSCSDTTRCAPIFEHSPRIQIYVCVPYLQFVMACRLGYA